ncbi:MAG: type III-B CRISPR module-associated protein Cmr3 [Chloroflexi bacterium]|nr:type III-B CRISPR module-associated protein Cmr3 [Chloroflexota bacterium]
MIRLFVEPLDVWLFRDGRPFTAGADHHARSVFPPSPRTLYGALRTKLLFDAVERGEGSLNDPGFVERTVGRPDDLERLTLRGPLLGRRRADSQVERFFPAPLDLARTDDAATSTLSWRILTPRADVPGLITDIGLAVPWADTDARPASAEGQWLPEGDFFVTLLGERRQPTPASDLYETERRSGIELDAGAEGGRTRGVVREGRLYSIAFVRPSDGVGLCLDVDGLDDLGEVGLIGLGGEGRASRYQTTTVPTFDRSAVRERVFRDGRFKLVLVTPALFDGGWLPSWIDPATMTTSGNAAGLRLVGAAVGRSAPVGGFDVRAGRPHVTRPAVPAGSVYWFEEIARGAAGRAFDALDGRTIADEAATIGFGLCYLGVW